MVAGDFNAISDVSEKLGCRPQNLLSFLKRNAMINDCGIIHCGYEGSKYTYTRSNTHEWGLWQSQNLLSWFHLHFSLDHLTHLLLLLFKSI